MAKFQEGIFTHDPKDTDNGDVKGKYEEWSKVWPNVPPLRDDKKATGREQLRDKINLFGDPFDPRSFRQNLTKVDIRPYKFAIKDRTHLTVHEGIAHRVEWVLQEIAAWGKYEIRYLGGHDLRYRKNPTTQKHILGNLLRYGQAEAWYRKAYGGTTSWMEYCLLYDLANRPGEVIWGMVSNHSFGTAIDINPSENDLGSNTWDMPPEIAKLFLRAGFGWGGLYETTKDAMHFEYELPYLSLRPPTPQFPLCPARAEEPPMRQYYRNETGRGGGFYPIGRSYNLHMGAHFDAEDTFHYPAQAVPDRESAVDEEEQTSAAPAGSPATEATAAPDAAAATAGPDATATTTATPAASADALVRTLGPGYVVAARLGKQTDATAVVSDFVGRSTGFVLLRHALREVPKGKDEKELKEVPFYSLYMHLETIAPGSPLVRQIPWLARMLMWRFGDAVNLDANHADFGKSRPLAAKAAEDAASAQVVKEAGAAPEELLLKSGETRTGVVRPATEELQKAVEALLAGKVVTFGNPTFVVGQGEAVGGLDKSTSGARGHYLHWELFAPASAGFVAEVEKLAGHGTIFTPVKESSGKDDNFFESSELADLLAPCLTSEEQPKFRNALSLPRYQGKLRALIRGETYFAPKQSEDDAKTGGPFTYPVVLDIANPFHAQIPPPPAGGYKLEVTFEPRVARGTISLTEVKPSYRFTIQVPAPAQAIKVACKDLHIDERYDLDAGVDADKQATWDNFIALSAMRWRRVSLASVTEWRPENLRALVNTLNSKRNLALDAEKLAPLAWYARKATDKDPLGEHALDTDGGTIFDGSAQGLPADGKLEAIHPVTGTWLFALLDTLGKAGLRSDWQPKGGTIEPPFYWSIVAKKDEGKDEKKDVRRPLYFAVAVARVGVRNETAELTLTQGDRTVTLHGPYDNGVAVVPLDFPLWGKWQLGAKDATSPKPPEATLSVEFDKPTLVPKFQHKLSKKGGLCTATLIFPEDAPPKVEALMRFRIWQVKSGVNKVSGDGELSDIVVPIRGLTEAKHGQASITWDPGSAFGLLLDKAKLPPGQKLLVRMEAWVVNGLDREVFDLEEEDFNVRASKLPAKSQPVLADEDNYLLSEAVSLVTLKPARFEDPSSILRVDKQGNLEVTVRFPLAGDPAGWKKAGLVIQKEEEKEPKKVAVSHTAIQRTFRVEDSDIGREVKYLAIAHNKDAMFNGVNVEPPPKDIAVTVDHSLEEPLIELGEKMLVVSLRTKGWPVNGAFRLSCQGSVSGPAATTMRKGWRYAKPMNGGSVGGIDDEGVFRAMIPRAKLAQGATYQIKVGVVTKSEDGKLGTRLFPPQTLVHVEGGAR